MNVKKNCKDGCLCSGFTYEVGEHPGICDQCRHADTDHRTEKFEPPTVTPIGNVRDLLAKVCAG